MDTYKLKNRYYEQEKSCFTIQDSILFITSLDQIYLFHRYSNFESSLFLEFQVIFYVEVAFSQVFPYLFLFLLLVIAIYHLFMLLVVIFSRIFNAIGGFMLIAQNKFLAILYLFISIFKTLKSFSLLINTQYIDPFIPMMKVFIKNP